MFIPRCSHFDWVIMGSTTQFLCRKLLLFLRIFWFAASAFFRRYLFSSEENTTRSDISFVEKTGNGSSSNEPEPELCPQIDAEAEAEQDAVGFVADGFGQKETSEFSFEFKFPTFEEFSRSRKENGDSISFGETNKCEFVPMKSCSRFVEEPETVSFAEGRSTDKDFVQISSEAKAVVEEVPEGQEDVPEKIEAMAFEEEKGKETDAQDEHDSFDQAEKEDSSTLDSDSGSISSSPLRLILNRLIDSYSDGFLSDGDFREEFELDNLAENNGDEVELHDELSDLDENYLDYSSKVHKEDGFHGEEDTYKMEELRKLEEAHLHNVGKLSSDFLSEKDFQTEEDNAKNEEHGKKPAETTADSGKVSSKNSSDWDSEDSNKLESLWEHQELIEQLKMELKKVRATGLPTILEESESPKISEDLKPWKIDEKFPGQLNLDGQKPRQLPLWLDHGNSSHLNPIGNMAANSNPNFLPELIQTNMFGLSAPFPHVLKEEEENNNFNHLNQQDAPAHMSATALLQKAAQMGSTRSSNSPLFNTNLFTSSSSLISLPNFNNCFNQQNKLNELMNTTSTISTSSSSLMVNAKSLESLMMKPSSEAERSMTRDFLGVGGGDRGGGALLQQELAANFASLGSAMDLSHHYSGN